MSSGGDGLRHVLDLIDALDGLIHNAKAVPLTDQVRVDRQQIYDLLDGIAHRCRKRSSARNRRRRPPFPVRLWRRLVFAALIASGTSARARFTSS